MHLGSRCVVPEINFVFSLCGICQLDALRLTSKQKGDVSSTKIKCYQLMHRNCRLQRCNRAGVRPMHGTEGALMKIPTKSDKP